MQENRHRFRVPCELPVLWAARSDAPATCTGTILDISSNGVRLRTADPPTRSLVRLVLHEPDAGLELDATAAVVRIDPAGGPGSYVWAAAFRDLSPPEQSRLSQFVFSHARRVGIGAAPVHIPAPPSPDDLI